MRDDIALRVFLGGLPYPEGNASTVFFANLDHIKDDKGQT
jgi:hypothetical protein